MTSVYQEIQYPNNACNHYFNIRGKEPAVHNCIGQEAGSNYMLHVCLHVMKSQALTLKASSRFCIYIMEENFHHSDQLNFSFSYELLVSSNLQIVDDDGTVSVGHPCLSVDLYEVEFLRCLGFSILV